MNHQAHSLVKILRLLPLALMESRNRIRSYPFLWDTATTTLLSTIGNGVGFLIPLFIARWFGITSDTDAFFFSYGLILFFSMTVAPVVESVIVPYIAEARKMESDVAVFVGRILCITGVALTVISVAFLPVVKPLLHALTDFEGHTLNLVYQLLIEFSPLTILLVCTSILSGTLNAYGKFAFPAISPAFRAVVNIGAIYGFKDILGIHAIAIGYLLGEIARLGILFAAAKRLNLFRLNLSFCFEPKLKEFFRTALYQVIGMLSMGLNPVVDRTMASWLKEGSVSILHYADRLYMIPVTFMATGLMVTLLTRWSSGYSETGLGGIREDVKKAVKWVGVASFVIAILLFFLHQPITKLAFGRGAFSHPQLSEVSWVWVCYLFGFMPYMMGRVCVRAHLAAKNTKVIMRYGLYSLFLNIFLNAILMIHFGVAGIALSTSVVSFFYFLYFFTRFRGSDGIKKA